MRFIIIFITVLLAPFFGEVFAVSPDNQLSGRAELRFTRSIDRIVEINQSLKKQSSRIVVEKLFAERETLTNYAKSLYSYIELQEMSSSGLDVSARYRLTLQKYALSCEIAALRMIIESITGKYTSEEKIMRSIPHFPGSLSGGIWGDPDFEFVGSYHGTQRLRSGYGVYERPLHRYLSGLTIPSTISNIHSGTTISRDARLSRILTDLEAGSHVLLWGDWCTLSNYEDGIVEKTDTYIASLFQIPAKNRCSRDASVRSIYWTTPSGKQIRGISGEHAFLLLGYLGKKESPTHIIVWDTDTGKHYYEFAEWMRKWELLDYRTLTVPPKTPLKQK